MRIFLDANILFSAARADGALRQLVDLLILQQHDICVDPYVLEEARRNLTAKTQQGPAYLEQLSQRLQHLPLPPSTLTRELTSLLPDKDCPVLASAIHSSCDLLITGDRTHFGSLYETTVRGVTILSPAQAAELLT